MVALGRNLMGTRFEIVLADDDDPARLQAAGEEALDEIERLEGLLSAYGEDSDVSRCNKMASREWVCIHPTVFSLLQRALALGKLTDGAFDITIMPLLRAWGFAGGHGHMPDPGELSTARELVGGKHVLLDGETNGVHFDVPGVELDLGAIGKGFALDCAMEGLRDAGVQNALLHAGTSTVVALGRPPDADAWYIAIQNPNLEGCLPVKAEMADGQALSVSAAHGKSFTGSDGVQYGHVLDPRAGAPAHSANLSAVATQNATNADALSTALLVLGAEGLGLIAGIPIGQCSALVLTDGEMRHIGHAFI